MLRALPIPTEQLISSPYIPNEDSNIGDSDFGIDAIILSPPRSPTSHHILLSVLECHALLNDKMNEAFCDLQQFQVKKPFIFISKLLVLYHEFFDKFELINNKYFYPCVEITILDTSASWKVVSIKGLCLKCAALKLSKDR